MASKTAFTHRVRVGWGDCDPAGIVFYPTFFRWADDSFHAFGRSLGFDQASLRRDHAIFGTPLGTAQARFHSPARDGDTLDIEVDVDKLGTSSVVLSYRMTAAGRPVAEVVETRIFVALTDGSIRSVPIPPTVAEAIRRATTD